MTKTQIDKLGDRLKAEVTEADLRLLDEYRLSYAKAYDKVVSTIQGDLGLSPSGRPAKSTKSIVEKLRRESIRLTQMQDIAGCRLIVDDMLEQDRLVERFGALLPNGSAVDRRETPSFGYRAVHFIAKSGAHLIEVQIRTKLQHRWAEFSEKVSDTIDPAIKYGGGIESARSLLIKASSRIAAVEALRKQFEELRRQSPEIVSREVQEGISKSRLELLEYEESLAKYLDEAMVTMDELRKLK